MGNNYQNNNHMEREQPDWSKCFGSWAGYTAIVCFYEFIGTFLLIAGINATGGSAAAIGLVLLFLLTFGA